MAQHVVVIGAGIVGAATAVELLRDGHRVTIVEPGDPGGEQAASYGNGTQLNPSSVIPMTDAGNLEEGAGLPGRSAWAAGNPLVLSAAFAAMAVALRPRRAATEARVAAIARALRPLLLDAPERHRRLAEEAGVGELIARQGVLCVFPSRADFEAEGLSWRLRRENGVRWLELSEEELRQREPSLDRRYKFALLVEENGQCRDPGAYVNALVQHACASGATLRRARATGLRIEVALPARGAHRRGRHRVRQGGDRGWCVVERCWPPRPATACRWRPSVAITC